MEEDGATEDEDDADEDDGEGGRHDDFDELGEGEGRHVGRGSFGGFVSSRLRYDMDIIDDA